MKKTYIAPNSEKIVMVSEGFLCASKFDVHSDETVNFGLSNKKDFGPKSIWGAEK